MAANLVNTKNVKKLEKLLKPRQMGTHLGVLSEGFSVNTNMTGFIWFSKSFESFCSGWAFLKSWLG